MAASAGEVAATIPRGHRNIADHMLRAASNGVLLLAEGANRRGAGEKRQRFAEARGEAGEVAAAVDLAAALGLLRGPQLGNLKHLAARVAALASGLIRHVEKRPS
jgi:four helix bundle protein